MWLFPLHVVSGEGQAIARDLGVRPALAEALGTVWNLSSSFMMVMVVIQDRRDKGVGKSGLFVCCFFCWQIQLNRCIYIQHGFYLGPLIGHTMDSY